LRGATLGSPGLAHLTGRGYAEIPAFLSLNRKDFEQQALHPLLIFAQGWRDQADADLLRHDPALCVAVSTRKGTSPLSSRGSRCGSRARELPGLPSQPTLSRLVGWLASEENRRSLREALVELASRRLQAQGRGRLRRLTLDVDSLPVEVHGAQPGSQYHGYYKARIHHPMVALAAETGDILDVRLREGAVHTADGALAFILELVYRVEGSLDAGFPGEELLSGLEARGISYVAWIRHNPVLNRMAAPHLKRPPGRPPHQPRTWFHETSYRAKDWSRPRRAVLVVQERLGKLLPHHFWLITSWGVERMDAEALLEHYRQRGTAEGYLGELMNVLRPSLSSSPRPKGHYRGEEPRKRPFRGRLCPERGAAAGGCAGVQRAPCGPAAFGESYLEGVEPQAVAGAGIAGGGPGGGAWAAGDAGGEPGGGLVVADAVGETSHPEADGPLSSWFLWADLLLQAGLSCGWRGW